VHHVGILYGKLFNLPSRACASTHTQNTHDISPHVLGFILWFGLWHSVVLWVH